MAFEPDEDETFEPDENWRSYIAETTRFLAHIATVSAGSIVVIATFAEKFSNRGPDRLLAVAAVGFAVAIAGTLAAYAAAISIYEAASESEVDRVTTIVAFAMAISFIAFALALTCFAVFAAYAVS